MRFGSIKIPLTSLLNIHVLSAVIASDQNNYLEINLCFNLCNKCPYVVLCLFCLSAFCLRRGSRQKRILELKKFRRIWAKLAFRARLRRNPNSTGSFVIHFAFTSLIIQNGTIRVRICVLYVDFVVARCMRFALLADFMYLRKILDPTTKHALRVMRRKRL